MYIYNYKYKIYYVQNWIPCKTLQEYKHDVQHPLRSCSPCQESF